MDVAWDSCRLETAVGHEITCAGIYPVWRRQGSELFVQLLYEVIGGEVNSLFCVPLVRCAGENFGNVLWKRIGADGSWGSSDGQPRPANQMATTVELLQ